MDEHIAEEGTPAEMLRSSLKDVSTVLTTAREKSLVSSKEVGKCALKQAQQNAAELFDALDEMMSAKDAAEATKIYTKFVSDAAIRNAEQLREIGEIFAKSSKEAWEPLTSAISKAMPKSK